MKTYLDKFRNNDNSIEDIIKQIKISNENHTNGQYKKEEKIIKFNFNNLAFFLQSKMLKLLIKTQISQLLSTTVTEKSTTIDKNTDLTTIIYYCNRKVNNY